MQVISRNRMSGLSLIELMVALAISVLLLMGVVALFVSSRASYETTERLSRIQENGRFALDQLATDIRATGYNDCSRATTGKRAQDYRLNVTLDPFPPPPPDELPPPDPDEEPQAPDPRWNFAQPVFGLQATDDGFVMPADEGLDLEDLQLNPQPSPEGDILVLRVPEREVRAAQVRITQPQPFNPLTVRHFDPMPFETGDIVMVSDCKARAFFQVTGYDPATGEISHAAASATDDGTLARPGNRSSTLAHRFELGASVVPIGTMIYYLAPSPGDQQRLSLYRKRGGTVASEEIAEGIERLEFVYGIDDEPLDARVDTYVTADGVEDWDMVMTVQVALLARAPDEYGTDQDRQTYVLLSTPEVVQAGPFADRNQRKVFTATLALRNQVID